MDKKNQKSIGRRSLVTGMSVAAAGLAVSATAASAQTQATGFEPARHDIDAWLGEIPGSHRIFIDTSTAQGGVDSLRYAFNLFNSQENAYGGTAEDLAMVVCFRHLSTPFGFGDAIWEKYGENFYGMMQYADPTTGAAPTRNLTNSEGPTGIDAHVARGGKFAICSAATRLFSGVLARATGASAEDVFEELVAGAIPNSHFVSAGVMAVTRAQEYDYSLLYAG